ncbi:cysteine desulfurase [Candidatus Woesearchaeota archaeon]|nr:cysteine desulfurase [Candidatus Woesearchaeota archaeon]
MNVDKIRKDFPILQKKLKGKPVVYFDNSCMTLRPKHVIDAMDDYYYHYPACALRSLHKLSKKATEEVEKARIIVQKFVGAKKTKEIVFTKNTSEALNLVANSFGLKKGDTVLTTDKEHNSNLIPWQVMARNFGIKRKIVKSDKNNEFSIENYEKNMNKNVKLVSVVHTSNLDGVTNPIKDITKIAHDFGAKVLVDAAQSVPHKEVNVKKLGVDLLAFSAHKMLGPSGMGALYGKEEILENLSQFLVGGETVSDSTYESHVVENLPEKFEAGLQNYAGIIGFGAACKYLKKVGRNAVSKHEYRLNKRLTEKLEHVDGFSLIGPKDSKKRGGILSFNIAGKDHHEIAMLSDSLNNVMVRSGAHCVHSWFNSQNLKGSVRASFYLYNTEKEVDLFSDTIKNISRL